MRRSKKNKIITTITFGSIVLIIIIVFLYQNKGSSIVKSDGVSTKSVIAEVVIVGDRNNLWYCYAKNQDNLRDGITVLNKYAVEGGDALKIGERIKIDFDGFVELLDPPSFTVVHSVESIGEATEDELQEGINYLNSEVASWHFTN